MKAEGLSLGGTSGVKEQFRFELEKERGKKTLGPTKALSAGEKRRGLGAKKELGNEEPRTLREKDIKDLKTSSLRRRDGHWNQGERKD